MITVGGANAYFKAHTHGASWAEYTGEQKSVAIQQARRDLARAIGRPMRDDEPPYVEGEKRRDEFAVYEQALYILLRDVLPEAGGNAIPPLDGDERKTARETLSTGMGKWSIEALSWLSDKLSVTTRLS